MEPADRLEVMDGDDVTDRLVGDQRRDLTCVRRVAQDVTNAEEHRGGRRSGNSGTAVLVGAGQRLLAQDVVACVGERLDRRSVVAVLGRDDHGVGDSVAGDEVAPVGETGRSVESERVRGSLTLYLTRLGELHHLGGSVMVAGDRLGVDRAAPAESNEGDAQWALEGSPEVL